MGKSKLEGDARAAGEATMKRAVTLVAVVLGCILGIAQAGAWSSWMCDVFGAYWARRR